MCRQVELSEEQYEAARAAFKREGEGGVRLGLHSVKRALLRYPRVPRAAHPPILKEKVHRRLKSKASNKEKVGKSTVGLNYPRTALL